MRKKKFLILLFVFSQQIILGQESLDSLKKTYYSISTSDSIKINSIMLKYLGNIFM